MRDCGLNCHEKCRELAPKTCTKYKAMSSKDPTVSDQLSDAAPGLGAAGADRWGHYYYYWDHYYYIITIHSLSECGFEILKTYQAPAHIWGLPR